MANCHEQFLRFNKAISLTEQEKKKLIGSRNSVSSKIKTHLKSINYYKPVFREQGSFKMGTIIRPRSGRYDLDLGIYFPELKGNPSDWPKTETIHKHIVEAISGHTSLKPIDKSSCIRLIYKSPYSNNIDLSYHIDLPIYGYKESFWTSEVKTVIGFKGERQWSEYSSPMEFQKWFEEKSNLNYEDTNQLRRLVQYLKAWKDNQQTSPKMPDGMILTVLAAKNYEPHDRDDIALYNMVVEFYYRLWWWFSVTKPVEPNNDLAEKLTRKQERNFLTRAKKLLNLGSKAIDEKSQSKSVDTWVRIFGERFDY